MFCKYVCTVSKVWVISEMCLLHHKTRLLWLYDISWQALNADPVGWWALLVSQWDKRWRIACWSWPFFSISPPNNPFLHHVHYVSIFIATFTFPSNGYFSLESLPFWDNDNDRWDETEIVARRQVALWERMSGYDNSGTFAFTFLVVVSLLVVRFILPKLLNWTELLLFLNEWLKTNLELRYTM